MAFYKLKEKISLKYLIFVFALLWSIIGLALFFEEQPILIPKTYSEKEIQLFNKMLSAMDILRTFYEKNGIEINSQNDPNFTGFIGEELTDITTTIGTLTSKRTSTNPEWVVWFYRMLNNLSIKPNDYIAVNLSGSFPALNLAAIIAIEAKEAIPVIISSIGSSTWGANRTIFAWLDMETLFFENGIIKNRTETASLGGDFDKGPILLTDGREIALKIISRNKIKQLNPKNLEESIKKRIELFEKNNKPKLLINIGGNHPALGACPHGASLPNGLLYKKINCNHPKKGIIIRFLEKRIPVMHILNITKLAKENNIALDPVPFPTIYNTKTQPSIKNQAANDT